MAGKADFTEEEWETMQKGVAGSAPSGFARRSRLLRHVQGGRRARRTPQGGSREEPSQLVRELAEMRGTGFGLTDSPQEVETATLDAPAPPSRR